jgi:hypothetical protein
MPVMDLHSLTNALISVRCPYCVDGLEFRPMQLRDDGFFICGCGHTAQPRAPQFRCSCPQCKRSTRLATILDETGAFSGSRENPREVEVMHSVTLLSFEEGIHEVESDETEMISRELEIKKQLVALYEQEKAFAHPTPAEQPSDYEPEELEIWARMRAGIEALENELANMTKLRDHS